VISQKFFFIECYGKHPIAPIAKTPRILGRWTSGLPLEHPVTEPIVYTLDLKGIFDADEETREGMDLTEFGPDDYNIKPLMTTQRPPLMRNDLIAAMQSVGVDNLELFPATVRNPINNRGHDNFSAFNVVGVADLEWGRDLRREINQRDYRINTPPFLIFRLYDDGPIVVYDSVRLAIENANIESVEFIPTYENR